ncbi:hypothetical protein BDZ94DRAFT_1305845 [Collybia nuda]|uniref:Uncharacterized protein n=1 Tax=Collybia nuda TaxID=64659 RepID=A0A9P5YCZ4_9AGAR|nr:hypothetical protein BDZ94DRAFT_1305845 [Collybia nuda]
MGGFMVHSENGDYFLRPENLCTYLNNGQINITEEQIQDKSKGDRFTKGFVVLQTTWFIVQTLARVIARLPITELEYSTLAFTALNGVMEKQGDDRSDRSGIEGDTRSVKARLPIIDKDPEKGGNEKHDPSLQTSDLFSLAQGLYMDPDGISTRTVGYTLAVGVLFGGIHCLAWLSHFPTATEELIWRIASAITTVVPAMLFTVWFLGDNTNSLAVALGILLIPYIIARLLLLFLIFTTLRSLPPDAYVTVQWTTFIPHI